MKRKLAAIIMAALLVFSMAVLTGCGDNNGDNDLSQTPDADKNLTNDDSYDDRSGVLNDNDRNDTGTGNGDNLGDDLRNGADDLGDDIRDGADDVKNGVEDVLDGNDNRNNQ